MDNEMAGDNLVKAELSIEETGNGQLRLEITQTHPDEIEASFDGNATSVAGFIIGFLGANKWQ